MKHLRRIFWGCLPVGAFCTLVFCAQTFPRATLAVGAASCVYGIGTMIHTFREDDLRNRR